MLGLRGRHQFSDQRSNRIRAPSVASTTAWDRGGGEADGQIASTKRAADGSKKTCREIIDEKREQKRAKNRSLRSISGATSLIQKF